MFSKIGTPEEAKDYKITVLYEKRPQRIIEGSFDKEGLPNDFEKFIEIVREFMLFFGLGEIFNPSIYNRKRKVK